MTSNKTLAADPSDSQLNGCTYHLVKMASMQYCHSHSGHQHGTLVDRGANGGICGTDVLSIFKDPHRHVDVQGIDNHQVVDIPLVTTGGVARTQCGEVILILHQYAYLVKGKTIHCCGQMEMFGCDVSDKSLQVPGGLQRICTADGYILPLNIRQGLPYLSMRSHTDIEWETLLHIILTSDDVWDPSTLDRYLDGSDEWFDALLDEIEDPTSSLFDEHGNYRFRQQVHNVRSDHPCA